MSIPPNFQFTQGNLQDYVDCPRRFQLRHLLQRAWPAPQAEPLAEIERRMELGQAFHRLIHQHTIGISEEVLARTISAPELTRWWHNYLTAPPPNLPTTLRHAEIVLATPLSDHRLVAKYDLLAVEPGQRLVIVDWKTSRHRPAPSALENRLQTRIYRYLLVKAGVPLNQGQPVSPEQVEMIYWFADYPRQPAHLPYSSKQFTADEDYLLNLIAEIEGRDEAVWPLTPDESCCRFCPYRSLCERDVSAATPSEVEDELNWPAFDLDLEQIAEIAF